MKKILLLTIALSVFQLATAQHESGTKNLNIGLGLGSQVGTGSTVIPPISASFELGIKDNISVGGYVGYTSSDFAYFGGGDWTYTYTIVGARASYHKDLLGMEKLDTYAGVMLGYNIVSVNYGNTGVASGAAASSLAYSIYAGGRYLFADKIGAFAELGYGIAWLQVGLNVRL